MSPSLYRYKLCSDLQVTIYVSLYINMIYEQIHTIKYHRYLWYRHKKEDLLIKYHFKYHTKTIIMKVIFHKNY